MSTLVIATVLVIVTAYASRPSTRSLRPCATMLIAEAGKPVFMRIFLTAVVLGLLTARLSRV